jgi:predicted dienelactone hydrolase
LVVHVWYPARATAGPCIPYLEHFDAVQKVVGEHALRKALGPSYPLAASGELRTHAVTRAPVADGSAKFPLLVFSHGGGLSGLAYSMQIEELVSHGYIVAAIDHTYETFATVFPDGRVIPFDENLARTERLDVWSADIRFVLDELTRYNSDPGLSAPWFNRIDEGRIGAFGHSVGGRAVARACQTDKRIRACLNEDGILAGGLPFAVDQSGRSMDQPFLLLMTSAGMHRPDAGELARLNLTQQAFETMRNELVAKQTQLFAGIRGGSYQVVVNVPGISHMSFSDLPYLSSVEPDERKNDQRSLDIIRAYTLAFFDKYLKHLQDHLLDAQQILYPEVTNKAFPAAARP